MVAAILVRLPLVLLPLVPTPSPTADCQLEVLTRQALEERAEAQFVTAVDRYVLLHRRLERSLPPEVLFADPEDMFEARETLAAALREARPQARRGAIFTPAVAELFRDRIDAAVERYAIDLYAATRGAYEWADEADVHAALPFRFPADMWPPLHRWPALLSALPPLPEELEYRLANRSLVLLDTHANLVVDVLEDAVPASGTPLAQ